MFGREWAIRHRMTVVFDRLVYLLVVAGGVGVVLFATSMWLGWPFEI